MDFSYADRLKKLPPYLFIEIDKKRKAAQERGVDVINLGIGDPDLPTPDFIVEALARAARDPANHSYPLGGGHPRFREAAARWLHRRFGVALDPSTEILALIGSKEGIGHLPLGVLNPGDIALVPDPAYPVYLSAVHFAGAEPFLLPLREEAGFLPDLEAIPADVLRRARLLWLNYPNNPTAAAADLGFLERAVEFARKHGLLLVNDAAYSEVYYDGVKPPSILQVAGAGEVSVEFHSLSKTFNMTGWRLGFAAGNPSALRALAEVKGNVDSGAFNAVQLAGAAALEASDAVTDGIRAVYQERRDLLIGALRNLGWSLKPPAAAFYVWCRVPDGSPSMDFCGRLLERAGVVVTPGVGFGAAGEGYFRMTLCTPKERLAEAVERIRKVC